MDKKTISFNEIEKYSEELNNLSKFLHENPETAYQEFKAHDYLCDYLENKKFKIERHFMHDTGFRASYATGETPHFAILVEYDALPKIGHACGHNIIAQSSITAAIGLKAAMDSGLKCKLSVLGTPAEEGGGGKIKFVSEGIFKDVDIALMSHPFKMNLTEIPSLAVTGITISFRGKDAHASVEPWNGINALDAAVLAYQAVSCFRQQMNSDYRIHGIISKGGDAPNIIPSLTEMIYLIRTPKSKELKELLPHIYSCFNGAAKMTGCEVEIKESTPFYEEGLRNEVFSDIFEKNAVDLGITFSKLEEDLRGSTDCGNVSQVCPTIHPMFFIGTKANIHSKEFADHAGKPEANAFGILQGKAMCAALIDVLVDETGDILKNIKTDFEKKKRKDY